MAVVNQRNVLFIFVNFAELYSTKVDQFAPSKQHMRRPVSLHHYQHWLLSFQFLPIDRLKTVSFAFIYISLLAKLNIILHLLIMCVCYLTKYFVFFFLIGIFSSFSWYGRTLCKLRKLAFIIYVAKLFSQWDII